MGKGSALHPFANCSQVADFKNGSKCNVHILRANASGTMKDLVNQPAERRLHKIKSGPRREQTPAHEDGHSTAKAILLHHRGEASERFIFIRNA